MGDGSGCHKPTSAHISKYIAPIVLSADFDASTDAKTKILPAAHAVVLLRVMYVCRTRKRTIRCNEHPDSYRCINSRSVET